MAQLRQDIAEFTARDAEILVLGPGSVEAFSSYFEENGLPFIGLPDSGHQVLRRYGQEIKLVKLGRMPALVVVDKDGYVRYAHYGSSMRDIPPNIDVLALLDELNGQAKDS